MRRPIAEPEVPVYPAAGANALERLEDLSLRPGIRFVPTPRRAAILLVAGRIRSEDRDALRRIHAQLPHPRASLWWASEPVEGIHQSVALPGGDDPLPPLRDLHRQLRNGERASESDLLPDAPPHPWRGRGDHGQGGEGMMGGTPYGRPMAMLGEDLRDGLKLDAYTARFGPFLSQLPPGLVLETTLQGDVLQQVDVIRPPLPTASAATSLFRRAAREPMPLADLERARAVYCMRCVGRLLAILDLRPQAERFRRAAAAVERGQAVAGRPLRRLVRFSGTLQAIPPRLGHLEPEVAEAVGGVAARAAGLAPDAREESVVYRALGFRVHAEHGNDARARLRQWLAEIEQSLRLAADAGGAQLAAGEGVEPPWPPEPHGRKSGGLQLGELLRGLEWQEALLVIASLDIGSLQGLSPSADDSAAPQDAHGDGE